MSELMDSRKSKKEILKDYLKRLNEGANPELMRKEFLEKFGDLTTEELSKAEEELVREGMPKEHLHKMCEIHIAALKVSQKEEKTQVPEGHPVSILMEEHNILLGKAGELKKLAEKLVTQNEAESDDLEKTKSVVKYFQHSEKHYLREENVLFPFLEKHGVTQPPAIMWREHDMIRSIEKNLYSLIETFEETDFYEWTTEFKKLATALNDMLTNHFYKENNILFPTGINLITDEEWKDIRLQFDELGYCCFTPDVQKSALQTEKAGSILKEQKEGKMGVLTLPTGELTAEQAECILNTLPFEITFIDKDDVLKYFNQKKDMIFVRTPAVLGRAVQNCHPEKSVHLVNKILQEFRNGTRDVAEFWLTLKERLIHIRYYPLFNKENEYVGCMEVTQDITDIKTIEGSKRLL